MHRIHVPLIALAQALLVLVLVLLSGIACVLAHGQTLAGVAEPGVAEQRGPAAAAPAPEPSPHPMPDLRMPFGECFFAGALPLALSFCAALGWLPRHCQRRFPPRRRAAWVALRNLRPKLHPGAP